MAEIDAGTEIAGYRIESVIGRGGMAVVYRAEDTRLGRKVALKLLTPSLAENEQFQQRFIRESRLAASLDHPNIVPIYEAGESEGHLFIAMRYVPGSDLKALLTHDGPLPPARILRLFVQIGDALDAAHVLGLVHRDVKPGNILITSVTEHSGHAHPDHVYLTDFGLTKRTSSLSGSLTGTGHFLGTVDYVSPEQIQGAPVGPSTDIYALGCVLYECLTGRLPFTRDDDAAVLWAHLVELPPPVTAVRPELPPAVNDVVARAMAKAPEDRYDSCRDLVRDLEYALNASVEQPSASRAQSRQPARHSSRAAYPIDEVPPTGELARSQHGARPAALPDHEPAEQPGEPEESQESLESGETVGWVSHPSLPPGVMQPPTWGPGTPAGVPVGEPKPTGDDEEGAPEEDYGGGVPGEEGYGGGVPGEEDYGGAVPGEEGYGGAVPGEEEAFEEFADFDVDEPQGDEAGYPESDDAYEPPQEEAATPAATGRRRRGRVLAAVAVLVVVAVVAVVAFLQLRKEEPFVAFSSQEAVVPFALSHPESWTDRTGAATDVVLSPRPDAMGDTFLTEVPAADRWPATRDVLATAPGDATGVYVNTQATSSGTSTEALVATIETMLGEGVTVDLGSTHRQLRVGGAPAHEFEGVLVDPQAPGTRLAAMFDIVLPQQGGLALLVFFAAPDSFEAQRDVFMKVRDGVTFPS